MGSKSGLSTEGHADFIFEVSPDGKTFDAVRRAIVDELEAEYTDVLAVNIREHIHVDVVDIDPDVWVVAGHLNGDIPQEIQFEVEVPPNADAVGDVLNFLRKRVEDRYGPTVDADAVIFEKIGMRPRAWFIDAKVPPSTDG